ncbi:MAG: ATPase, T2SS/T4P/T4SS family [Planctomycetota bacterium]
MTQAQTTNPTPLPSDAAPPKPKRVGDLLLEHGLVTSEQIDQAIDFQKNRKERKLLGEVVVELGFVEAEQVLEVVADAQGLPFTRLTPALTDSSLHEMLPREFCEATPALPLFLVGGKLTVAIAEPDNVFLAEEIERRTGHPVQLVISPPQDIIDVLGTPEAEGFSIDEVITSIDISDTDVSVIENDITDLADDAAAEGSPVIKLVNFLIFDAVKERASDIHIEPDENRLRVRFRVDGRLYEKISPPIRLAPAVASRIKIMAGLDISERRVPQDGAITLGIERRQVDLRVSTMPGKFGEKVVMRIADQKNAISSLDLLGFSPDMLNKLRLQIHQPNGVVLVTGPTGSGKSTTLYSALAEINRDDINISTVEDPVEFNIPGVNQFQVQEKAGFSFASALRALLRQDPDVVMLGEIRDEETARIATQAAMTGHLVVSTLHTNDAPSAVTRIQNMGIEPYLVAAAVRGVLAQRLVRKLCPHCKEPDTTAHEDRSPGAQALFARYPDLAEASFHGAGCPKCRDSGFAGRLGLYELYIPGDSGLDAIANEAGLQELRKLATSGEDPSASYTTLMEDGLDKVRQGLTTVEEVLRATAL